MGNRTSLQPDHPDQGEKGQQQQQPTSHQQQHYINSNITSTTSHHQQHYINSRSTAFVKNQYSNMLGYVYLELMHEHA